MVRLRDTRSGVVVQVNDDMADRLGTAYEPADAEPEGKSATKRKTAE